MMQAMCSGREWIVPTEATLRDELVIRCENGPVGTPLEHIMVVGGTPKDWDAIGADEWAELGDRLGAVAGAAGARWLTIRPYGPHPAGTGPDEFRRAANGPHCTVIVDPAADGREAFAAAAAAVPPGEAVDEQAIARELYAPADVEPDLIVICGPHDRLPPSLVWELAYGELVFADRDVPTELSASELQSAIDEFHRRSRRFGGLDSD
jgi:undecaprenyl diphosphate synthase